MEAEVDEEVVEGRDYGHRDYLINYIDLYIQKHKIKDVFITTHVSERREYSSLTLLNYARTKFS